MSSFRTLVPVVNGFREISRQSNARKMFANSTFFGINIVPGEDLMRESFRASFVHYAHTSRSSQNRHPRHEFIPPLLRRVLVRPLQQRIVVDTLVDGTPAWPGFSLAFESCVAGAHQGLPDVVEAVRGVVGDFLGEVHAAVALLEVADEVGLLGVLVFCVRQGMLEVDMDIRGSAVGGTMIACILGRRGCGLGRLYKDR
jgi:hypothetical protein